MENNQEMLNKISVLTNSLMVLKETGSIETADKVVAKITDMVSKLDDTNVQNQVSTLNHTLSVINSLHQEEGKKPDMTSIIKKIDSLIDKM